MKVFGIEDQDRLKLKKFPQQSMSKPPMTLKKCCIIYNDKAALARD